MSPSLVRGELEALILSLLSIEASILRLNPRIGTFLSCPMKMNQFRPKWVRKRRVAGPQSPSLSAKLVGV